MRPLQTDLSVYKKFDFPKPPVGIKFLFFRPEGLMQLSKNSSLSFCEFLTEAHKASAPFYFARDNTETCVGKFLLGMDDMHPMAESGQIGERLGIFQEARANYKFYQHIPRFPRNVVHYVAVSPMDTLTFDPDVFIITATPAQAGNVMRSMAYSTGELLVSKTTAVMGCAWTYIYPYQSGNVNYVVAEMVHGMKARELFDEKTVLISIPYNWLPTMTKNLQEMKIDHQSREEFLVKFQDTLSRLAQESENP
jgi:uncharacterized protein (DUF169 family)